MSLIGEPGSGKSAIAAVLALSALDQWKKIPIRILDPSQFGFHWNPTRGDQLFWIDDAFGETQYERSKTMTWRQLMPQVRAALIAGSRFIFTSRDYIFRRALDDFRRGDIVIFEPSRVVITVEALSLAEKQEILYNHIKLGDQPRAFRSVVKRFLPIVARRARVLPEVARRLGNAAFTKSLQMSDRGLAAFADNPDGYLLDVIKELNSKERACLLYMFARGGMIPVMPEQDVDENLLMTLGISVSEVREALTALRDTFVRLADGQYWTYQHPTIHDALTTYVSRDPSLVSYYVRGASIHRLLSEVAFKEEKTQIHELIIVPVSLYSELCRRIVPWLTETKSANLRGVLLRMLAGRANHAFFTELLFQPPELPKELVHFSGTVEDSDELDLLEALDRHDLLNEDVRKTVLMHLERLAWQIPDSSWLGSHLVRSDEQWSILYSVRSELIDRIDNVIKEWVDSWDSTIEAEEYMEPLSRALRSYRDEFDSYGETEVVQQITEALASIKIRISDMEDQYGPDDHARDITDFRSGGTASLEGFIREHSGEMSRFDDLDELDD